MIFHDQSYRRFISSTLEWSMAKEYTARGGGVIYFYLFKLTICGPIVGPPEFLASPSLWVVTIQTNKFFHCILRKRIIIQRIREVSQLITKFHYGMDLKKKKT